MAGAREKDDLSRAALAAANRDRRDLLPQLKELTELPEPVGAHARWAIDRLTEENGRRA